MAKPRNYSWCLHCERAAPNKEWGSKEWPRCPYPDCDGGPGDRWEWTRIREVNPEYPALPERGVVYGMYGP